VLLVERGGGVPEEGLGHGVAHGLLDVLTDDLVQDEAELPLLHPLRRCPRRRRAGGKQVPVGSPPFFNA